MARHNYVHRNSLTFAQLLARLQAMREVFRSVAALRSALSTRGNLLLELLALRPSTGCTRAFGSTLPPVGPSTLGVLATALASVAGGSHTNPGGHGRPLAS